MREYNTYIFDLDGTLLSTLDDLAASVNHALRTYDMPEHPVEDIRWFVGNGVRVLIAVVSNKFYAATQELCRHFFGAYVDVAIGERENIRKKPAPDTVLEALRLLGVGKEGDVYVGDSDVDVATARNSGLPCVSVLWGFRDRDFLLKHGATEFISVPSQLLP